MTNEAYIYNVIVEQHPHAMTFDNANVVSTAQPAAAMNHDRYQVIHSIWVARIVRLHQTAAQRRMQTQTH